MGSQERNIVVATLLAQAVVFGATIASFTLFLRPLAEAFSASTLEVSLGLSLLTMTLAACGIPVGTWLDRGSPRTIMLTGGAILVTALLLASQAASLWQLAVLCVFCGTGIPMLGPLTTAAVVGKSVDPVQRGRALGVANLGVPLGGLVFGLVGAYVLEAWGWRTALQVYAGMALVTVFPAVWLAIPRQFGELGGDAGPEGVVAEPAEEEDWTPARLLRSPVFRTAALGFGFGMGTTAGWVAHLAPYLQDVGASLRYAGTIVAVSQGLAIVGTVVFGAMADRRGPVGILLAILGIQVAGFAVLLVQPGQAAVSVAALLMGAATGGFLPVFGHLLAGRFGVAALGRAVGVANLALLPFGFGLPLAGGAFRDAFGHYGGMIMLCMGLLCIGMALLARLARTRG